jgi:hypothetical protein
MLPDMGNLVARTVLAWMLVAPALAADTAWTAEQIVERLIARSEQTEPSVGDRWHRCRRVTVTEELDQDGKVTRTKTRELQVASTNGVETVGPWKGGAEMAADPDGEEVDVEERKGKGKGKGSPKAGRKERKESRELGGEVFRQFQYTLEGEELVRGRTNFVLRFSGKPGLSGGDMGERLIRSFQGRLWIDATDFELSRVDAHLSRSFEVFGGIAASIQKFDFQMERQPIAEGLWETGLMATEIQGRKVFSSMRSRFRMEQDRFEGGRKAPAGSPSSGGQP